MKIQDEAQLKPLGTSSASWSPGKHPQGPPPGSRLQGLLSQQTLWVASSQAVQLALPFLML